MVRTLRTCRKSRRLHERARSATSERREDNGPPGILMHRLFVVLLVLSPYFEPSTLYKVMLVTRSLHRGRDSRVISEEQTRNRNKREEREERANWLVVSDRTQVNTVP